MGYILGNLEPQLDRTAIPDLILNGTFAAEGTAVVKSLVKTDLYFDENTKVQIKFHDSMIHTIAASKLKERLEGIEDLRDKLDAIRKRSRSSGLFVITKTLRVDRIEYVLESGDKTGAEIKFSQKDTETLANVKVAIHERNRLSTKHPLLIGYKSHKLETIATALGEAGALQLHPLSPKEVRQIEEQSLDVSVETDFQVYGLLLGFGNYPDSQYVGGNLLEAKHSVKTIARHITRLPGAQVEELVHAYNPLKKPRVNKEEIQKKIDEFGTKYRDKMNEKSLVIFYYFGHGLSEPKSRMPLLIPEVGNAIFLSELVDKLKELPGQVLILIDACRERERSEELRPEIVLEQALPPLPPGIGRALTQWARKGGADLIFFGNSFAGPDPVIFSSPDGGDANPVPHVLPDGYVSKIGPLAKRFDEIWYSTISDEETLTFEELVQGMLKPGQDGEPSGYPAWQGTLNLAQATFVKMK